MKKIDIPCNTDDENGFTPLGMNCPPVEEAERENARTGHVVFRAKDGFEAALPETLVERILSFARKAAPNEWCGLLVGRSCRDVRGEHLLVLGVMPDTDCKIGPGSFATTAESEFRTRRDARHLYPDCTILAWVHSHPRLGLFFSSVDRRNQATWTWPQSLGIVVDPWHPERIAAYRGPESERMVRVAEAGRTQLESVAVGPARIPTSCASRSTGRRTAWMPAMLGGLALGAAALCAVVGLSAWSAHQNASIRSIEARIERLETPPPSVQSDEACLENVDASATAASIAMNARGMTLNQAREACGDAGMESGRSDSSTAATGSALAAGQSIPEPSPIKN